MDTNQPIQKKWYDNKVLLIVLFFLFPPLGIYGMLKHNTATWKKLLYILPSLLLMLFVIIGIVANNQDKYKTAMEYYNKKDYQSAYTFFEMVSPDDKNYNDASAKLAEIKPIVDSIKLAKETQKETAKENKEREKALKENPTLAFPETEQGFISTINEYKTKYKDATNDLKKSAIRTERGNAIKSALGNSLNFKDWVGVVKEMRTTSNGKAVFVIELDKTGIEIGTINNEFSDMFDNTLIEQSNPLYSIISELKPGDECCKWSIFKIFKNGLCRRI